MAFDDTKTYAGPLVGGDPGNPNQGNSSYIQFAVAASRPAAGNKGIFFFATDTGAISYDDGAAWQIIRDADMSQLQAEGGTDTAIRGITALRLKEAIAALGGTTNIIKKASDESVTSSTTLQNDDDFSFSVAANETWFVEIHGFSTVTSGAGGLVADWSLPAGATVSMANIGFGAGNTGAHVTSGGKVTSSMAMVAQAATISIGAFRAFFVLKIGGTAGTAQFQWAQETSDATATVIKADSVMIAHKI